MQNRNLISVIIPTYNHPGRELDLLNLINSLLLISNSVFIGEIIIVDNGNSLSVDKLEVINERIKVIKESRVGLNYARNSGVYHATLDIISFVDDDVIVSPNWAKSIVGVYASRDVLCIGGPVLVNDRESNKYPRWFSEYFLKFLLPPIFPLQAGIIHPPYYLIGANISFKREIFDNLGLFDLELDRIGKNLLSNGDIEFIMRIPINKVWYEPQAIVFEKIPETRLTRWFMARRLFWQGISDYIMTKKRGLNNFYDKDEVLFTHFFLGKVISVIAKGRAFEACCMFIRQFGFKYGRIYSILKNKRQVVPTS